MPFQKGNKYRIERGHRELDTKPICFKGWKGQKEKLRNVPDWPNQVREFVESLIEEEKPS